MRFVPFIISLVITVTLIIILNTGFGTLPPIGKLLSPQHGLWQNAEPFEKEFSEDINFPLLKSKVDVYFDERLVPHVFAQNDEDAYFVQGYLHARFRLWQMELQTHAAAGRLSEIFGERALQFDRGQRRLGMVFAAKNMLKEMESNPLTKAACDSYTAGVNAYIGTLNESELPIEYKLLNYKPEKWNNLKIALFFKVMAKDLNAYERDFEFTNAAATFGYDQLNILYPQIDSSLDPIIPRGTVFPQPAIIPVPPPSADSLYFFKKDSVSGKFIEKTRSI